MRPQDSGDDPTLAQPQPAQTGVTAALQWLLLIVIAFYMATPASPIDDRQLVAVVLALYAGFVVISRGLRRRWPTAKAWPLLQAWAMLALVTVALWQSGRHDSPLLALYLLPLVLGALSLSVPVQAMHGALIVACYVGLALDAGVQVVSLDFLSRLLAESAPLALAAWLLTRLMGDVRLAHKRIHTLSETDELTGLWNMRAFNRVHRREHQHAARYARPYSVLMLDMDNLKEINDTYGHGAGNKALQGIARSLARITRVTDAVARFGGDEFIVLLHEADRHMAAEVAQRSRMMIEAAPIDIDNKRFRASASVGYASYPADGADPEELIALADRRMYADKRAGRRSAQVVPGGGEGEGQRERDGDGIESER